jgi:hypothetical protein
MKRATLAMLACLPFLGAQQAPPPDLEFACLYAVAIDLENDHLIVFWSTPPCAPKPAEQMLRWIAPLRGHCGVTTVYAAYTDGEPLAIGSRCVPPSKAG